MSVACENESASSISMLSSHPSFSWRFSKWAARKRKRALAVSKCAPEFSRIRKLMTSCLSFEPCDNFYKETPFASLGISSSPFFSGVSGTPSLGRRRNKLPQPAHSGNLVFPFNSLLSVQIFDVGVNFSVLHGAIYTENLWSFLLKFLTFWNWDLGQA